MTGKIQSQKYQKSILITGCSSGIGRYCALQLKKDGWRVFAGTRAKKDVKQLQEEGLEALHLDYTREASINSAFEKAMKATGGTLDALFNNGGYGQVGAVEDIPTKALREQFEVNFFGWHTLTNLVMPVMRKQGHGRIVHCSSVVGFVPFAWRGAYNASKHALEGLAMTMRLELEGTGIHVCLIEPGPIESKFSHNCLPHFINKIDRENSVHKADYEILLKRLEKGGGMNHFRLGPKSVYKKLEHSLDAKRPKARYMVTMPTYIMAIAQRVMPYFMLEKILIKNS